MLKYFMAYTKATIQSFKFCILRVQKRNSIGISLLLTIILKLTYIFDSLLTLVSVYYFWLGNIVSIGEF